MGRAWLVGNALWLQAGWWACVLGAHTPAWLLVIPVGLALHLWLCPAPGDEAWALLRVALLGCIADSLLGLLGVFVFEAWPLPLWLALMWLVLACGMRHSLAWAGRVPWCGALAGLVGGPLAYLAGARLAGVELPLGAMGTGLLLAPLWALGLPWLAKVGSGRECGSGLAPR